jgi:hypothetical protein
MDCLATGEFDAVVSVSALEHNHPANIPAVMRELRRVAVHGAPLLLTISASAADTSGVHAPSLSWLLTEREIAALYGLRQGYASDFPQRAEPARRLADSPRLRRWLALFYSARSDNGMPSGCWHPAYLPVGLYMRNDRTDRHDRPGEEIAPQALGPFPDMPYENYADRTVTGMTESLAKHIARLAGREVYFWGCGSLYSLRSRLFAESRPRCILVDAIRGDMPEDMDGLPVQHPRDVLPGGDILPIVIFIQDINAVYRTIREHYPEFTDLVFCNAL